MAEQQPVIDPIDPLVDPPLRTEAPADFTPKADRFLAALPAMVRQINAMITKTNALATWVSTIVKSYADSASGSASAADTSAKASDTSAKAASTSADGAASSLASSRVVQSAVEQAAGLPSGTQVGSLLRIKNTQGEKDWWLPVISQVGDTLVSSQAPDSTWLPTGQTFLQTVAPALFARLGVIADWPLSGITNLGSLNTIGGNNYQLQAAAYGNGYYVALLQNSSTGFRSQDAFNTLTQINHPSYNWIDVDYGNNRFVAVTSDTSLAMVSLDNGSSWTLSNTNLGSSADLRIRSYGGGFLAVKINANSNIAAVATTTDGNTWTTRTAPSGNIYSKPAFGAGVMVIVTADGCFTSSNVGVTWTKRTSFPFTPTLGASVVYGTGIGFLAINPQTLDVAFSVDGISWTTKSKIPYSSGGSNMRLAGGQGGFYVQNSDATTAYTTVDGSKWIPRVVPAVRGGSTLTVGSTHILFPFTTTGNTIRVKAFSYDPATQFYSTDPIATPQGLNQYVKGA